MISSHTSISRFLAFFLLVCSSVTAADVPPSGGHADAQGDVVPDGVACRLGTTRFRHWGGICSLAYSPDGKALASVGFDHFVRVWEAKSGKEIARLSIPARNSFFTNTIWGVTFSPDGRTLAICCDFGFWMWDWSKGEKPMLFARPIKAEKENKFPRTEYPVKCVGFSTDGKILVGGDFQGTVRVWDPLTNKESLYVTGGQDPMPSDTSFDPITFSPDAKFIAIPWPDRTIRMWDIAAKKEILRLKGHEGDIKVLRFSPDGKTLASGSKDGTLRLWDATTGQTKSCFGEHTLSCYCAGFSNDGKEIVTGDGVGRVRVWALQSEKLLHQFQGPRSGISSLGISPDSQILTVGGEDESLWQWNLETEKELGTDNGHRARVESVTCSHNGPWIASSSDDGTVRLWNILTGKELNCFSGHGRKVRAVDFSPDGKQVASAGDDGTVRLWEATKGGKQTLLFSGHQKAVYALTYCQGGRILASAGSDGMVRLWQSTTGKEQLTFKAESAVKTLAGSPNGSALAIGYAEKILIVDSQDGEELHRIDDPSRFFTAIAYSTDGRLLAVADERFSASYPVRIYETASWQIVRRLDLPSPVPKRVNSITFAQRNMFLAAGTMEGDILLWDLASGKRQPELRGQCGEVMSLDCSPDGTLLACGYSNATALIWKVPVLAPDSLNNPKLAKHLSEQQCQQLWDDLRSEDVRKAHDSIWQLIASPEQAGPFLKKLLKPVSPISQININRDIADLENNSFQVRQQAFSNLKGLGDLALPSLRRRLDNNPTIEEKKRVEELIRQAKAWLPDQLQILRAIQILENIGSQEAKNVLERMAEGEQISRLTQEAKASLQRLNKHLFKTSEGNDR